MSFTMAPTFFSTDLDRTAAFWGGLGFVETKRYEDSGFLIVEHPLGMVLHFGLAPDLDPAENQSNAYLRFSTSDEAVALYADWVSALPVGGTIQEPTTTFYGLVEWPILDPDHNLLRVGGSPDTSH